MEDMMICKLKVCKTSGRDVMEAGQVLSLQWAASSAQFSSARLGSAQLGGLALSASDKLRVTTLDSAGAQGLCIPLRSSCMDNTVLHFLESGVGVDEWCDRRDSQPYQTLKYSSKSHPGGDHRHEKMRDSSDVTPPCKMLRRSDSPENKHIDSTGHGRAKAVHTHRARDRDGGTSYSPQENSHNHSSLHSSNSHSNPSKTSDTPYEPGDDWSEHISSSGKKYYYNCRTEVSQWEKPKEWLEREQRQKEATKIAVVNSFPKDRDYRREAMQASAAPTGSICSS
ncbi:hypothetical protein INR49_021053 [Caranx melampygus]|nr:hypothetical protein INR49_021053 [Caranx melampygus]